jgi:hypothetical protein
MRIIRRKDSSQRPTPNRIDLELSMPLRLEAIDPAHPETVALVRGPLVLFAMADHPPSVSRAQLLSAAQTPGPPGWNVAMASGSLKFRPFYEIHDETYLTYLNTTAPMKV